jgi:hypothetical protein
VTAAVLGNELLFDDMRKKLRDEGDGRYSADRVYESEDIGVVFVMLHLLEDRSSVVISNFSSHGGLPDKELPPIDRLPERLRHLRANGIFDIEANGSEARVSYGPEVRRIAAKWGISIEKPVEKEAVGAGT